MCLVVYPENNHFAALGGEPLTPLSFSEMIRLQPDPRYGGGALRGKVGIK